MDVTNGTNCIKAICWVLDYLSLKRLFPDDSVGLIVSVTGLNKNQRMDIPSVHHLETYNMEKMLHGLKITPDMDKK